MPASTKLVSSAATVSVRRIRVRGGHYKFRALRLEGGNFSWPSESVTKRTRVLDVMYNASSNELVRTALRRTPRAWRRAGSRQPAARPSNPRVLRPAHSLGLRRCARRRW